MGGHCDKCDEWGDLCSCSTPSGVSEKRKVRVYVGHLHYAPEDVPVANQFHLLHPSGFGIALESMCSDFWTNYNDVLDLFPPDQIICCGPGGMRPLSEHPLWTVWNSEMSTGEFWMAVVDANWPEKEDSKGGEQWVSRL